MRKKAYYYLIVFVLTIVIIEAIVYVALSIFHPYILPTKKAILSVDTKSGYISQPYLNYINNPNQTDSKGNYPINSKGIRYHEEITLKKSNNTLRILFLGGSTTFGDVDDEFNVFPKIIHDRLSEKIKTINPSFQKVECLNAGVHGLTSAEILNHYHFKHQYLYPDLIVIHTGFNDAFAYSGINGAVYQPDYHNLRRVFYNIPQPTQIEKILMTSNAFSFFWIRWRYSIFLENSLEKNVFFDFNNDNNWFEKENEDMYNKKYNAFYNNYKLLVMEAQSKGSKVLFVPEVADKTKMPDGLGDVLINGLNINSEYLAEISLETDAHLCILPEHEFTPDLFLNDDGIHVNEIGEELKAKHIYDCIIELIKEEK